MPSASSGSLDASPDLTNPDSLGLSFRKVSIEKANNRGQRLVNLVSMFERIHQDK